MTDPITPPTERLSIAQTAVLGALAPGGVLSTEQLGRWAGLTDRRARGAARRLAVLGLIYGRATGRRTVLWQITPAGRDIRKKWTRSTYHVAPHKD